jgi:YD repeat-containing protein
LTYPENSLFITWALDENYQSGVNGHTTREYKDNQGKVVLKEVQKDDGTWLSTKYVYDQYGQLRCVVPPKATGPADIELCYFYTYDKFGRMITKKLPGAGTVYMVYDNRDRLVLVQDSVQRIAKAWLFTKYDTLNRPVMTGRKILLSSTIDQ